MKLMRLAMVAAFAVAGGIAVAEDYVDIGAMQAKLAAQEARLNDLQAKIYGDACGEKEKVIADGLTSLRKNAVVTIGGTVNQRWYSQNGKVESSLITDGNYAHQNQTGPNANNNFGQLVDDGKGYMTTRAKWNYQKFFTSDAKLEVKIDVNDYFDAYLKMNLAGGYYGTAENYWVRWKNVCNSGFGIVVGRDGMAYGTGFGVGGAGADNWNLNYGGGAVGGLPGIVGNTYDAAVFGNGTTNPPPNGANVNGLNGADGAMFAAGKIVPTHNYWDFGNTLQIKPYWEGANGRVKLEASIFSEPNIDASNIADLDDRDGYWYGRSNNFGFGSFSTRLTVVPVEGLTMSVSYLNMGQNNYWNDTGRWTFDGLNEFVPTTYRTTSRSQGIQAGIQYIPVCFNRLKLYANYGHGWDDYWIDDYKSDTWSFGGSFGITDQLTWYGYGDLLYVKNGQGNQFYKANGWALTTGLQYTLPYGINAEAGYRYERVDYKNRAGEKHTKYTGNLVYAHLGFNF